MSRATADHHLAICSANGAVLAEARAHPETRGMGTTCTAAIVLPDRLFVAQVGDSRAYLLHEGRLRLLTRDQTMVGELLAAGTLRPEDVSHFPYRHILTQAVGTRSTIEPATSEVGLSRGDRVLLCSDGLHGPVPDEEIARVLSSAADIHGATQDLIHAALAAGGPDNVTVVVADCE
jgi:serine/threonine protein phosphatase PrpC